jgi:hypothetical protein
MFRSPQQMKTHRLLPIIAAMFVATTTLPVAQAATLNVPSVPFPTIQAAIDAANAGDTILVAAGVYAQSLVWTNKDLVIQGAGEGQTIVTAAPVGVGPYTGHGLFTDGLSSASRIEDFTFSGNVAFVGGGMHNVRSNLSITRCTFSGNTGLSGAGGMFNLQSSPSVSNCTFKANHAGSVGEAGNGGGVLNSVHGNASFTNCVFVANSAFAGGGMSNIISSNPTLINCTFTANQADVANGFVGGGIANDWGSPRIINCLFWENMGGSIANLPDSFPVVTSSNVQGLPNGANAPDANGNFAADPLFVDVANGNLRLQEGSPSINTGSNTVVTSPPFLQIGGIIIDLDNLPRISGGTVDMGAYEADDTPTVVEIMETIQDLKGLVSATQVSPANRNSLQAKLNAALTALASDDRATAASRLRDFIKHVSTLIKTRQVAEADGVLLINAAQDILDLL